MGLLTFSSIENIVQRAMATLRRFPETLIVSWVCATVSLLMSHNILDPKITASHLMSLTLTIPLTFAVATMSERDLDRKNLLRLLGLLAGTIILVLFDLSWVESREAPFMIRYVQLSFGLHLLVAFSPFINHGTEQGFWQYNRHLFIRFLTAVLYTTTLQIGLAIALWAVNSLLGIKIGNNAYADLYIVIGFVFNTWFFLAGIPENLNELDEDFTYPRQLLFFTQYVLLPLVTIYFVILYLYTGKIIAQWDWPKGTIGYLVSAASIVGILCLLLVHPLRDSHEHKWIKSFSKVFYLALFPLVILLTLAIFKRTDDYGLTERRYFLFVVAGHLGAMATYFTFSERRNIKVIPISLCALAFLTMVGPWSAFNVSRVWQKNRLEVLLREIGAFDGKKIVKITTEAPHDKQKEITSIVEYFSKMHGYKTLQPWFDTELDDKKTYDVLQLIGVQYVPKYESDQKDSFSFYARTDNEVRNITGFEWYIGFQFWGNAKDSVQKFSLDESGEKNPSLPFYELIFKSRPASLQLKKGTETPIEIPIAEVLENVRKNNGNYRTAFPVEKRTASIQSPMRNVKVVFKNIVGSRDEKSPSHEFTVSQMTGDLFIHEKN